ncbi:MAG: hypothetical protein M3373_06515 [Gemmatimonadota bacterium]|nr:hypothetical protein [Gemmatimonadota bacterium]
MRHRHTQLALVTLALVAATATASAQTANYGSVEFPNSGAPAAQAHFLQGVLALHSFMYEDAAEAFREAQRIDPDFAMAYWGEAMTYDHPIWEEQDAEQGRAALKRLAASPDARLVKAGTAREQQYMRAVEILFSDREPHARDSAYAEQMERIHVAYPDDKEAAVLYALALIGKHHIQQTDRTDMLRAASIAERIFSQNPRHPGAAHILIHAYDDPEHARKALPAARAYAKIAPSAYHALHMPSHIFVQLGMWNDLVASNEAAYAASVQWAERKGLPANRRDYHSLTWLQYGYLQQGRHARARAALDSVERVASLTPSPRVAVALAWMRAQYALETRQRRAPALPGEVSEHGSVACARLPSRVIIPTAYAAGIIAARTGAPATAETAWECLRSIEDSALGPAERAELSMAQSQLGALIALASRRSEDVLVFMERAVAAEKSTVPFGPTGFIPAHELYGEVLLSLARPREAAEQFELALRRTPNRAASILGRARAAAMLRDKKNTVKYYAMLATMWQSADADVAELPEVLREAGT